MGNIAVVNFKQGCRDYDFINPLPDIKVGDTVVCDTSQGLTVGTVVSFKGYSTAANKLIVQRIDVESHNERLKRQKEIEELKKRMDKRRKELQDIQVYALLAKVDPEMAEMFNRYMTLEGK